MSSPEGDFETAVDQSSEREARERAIDDLETANECHRLAELVRITDLEEQYRERALTGLAHPQCKSTLRTLVESGDLPAAFEQQAETLLQETPDSSGAGP